MPGATDFPIDSIPEELRGAAFPALTDEAEARVKEARQELAALEMASRFESDELRHE